MTVMQLECAPPALPSTPNDRVAATLIFWHIKDFVLTAVECCAFDNPFIYSYVHVHVCVLAQGGYKFSLSVAAFDNIMENSNSNSNW